jgi:hypothetical protein
MRLVSDRGRLGPRCSSRIEGHSAQMRPGQTQFAGAVALATLAAFGCGLALAQGDLLFLAIFAAVSAVTIIEAGRCSR